MGLRPVVVFGILERQGAWAGPALRCFKRDNEPNVNPGPNIAAAFERELDAIARDASFAGLEIVQYRTRSSRGVTAFSVMIDRPGGADLELCERVAARLNGKLGEQEGNYALEVESAGLDRPLLRPVDYERFAGSTVRIVTTLTVDGGKTHRGMLRGLRGEAVAIENERGELLLPMATIKSANLEYDPRADLRRDKLLRKQSNGNIRKRN